MKKFSVLLLALAMLLMSLAGGALAETTERQTVNFWYLWTGVEAEGMEEIIANYNASQDVYEVVGLSVPDESKIVVAIASNEGPDVTDSFSSNVSSYYDQGIMLPLNDYISETGYDTSAFPEAMMECCTVDGNIVALPMNIINYMMYINTDLLDAAGVEIPTTGDELLEAARALTQVADDGTIEVLGMPVYPYGYYLDAMVYGMGGSYTDDGETLNVDNEGFRKAVELLKAYYDEFGYDQISAFQTAGSWLDSTDPFLNGQQAIRFDGSWMANFISQYAPDLNYTCLPIVTLNEGDTPAAVVLLLRVLHSQHGELPGRRVRLHDLSGRPGRLQAVADGLHERSRPLRAVLDEDMLAITDFPAYFDAIQTNEIYVLPTFSNWSDCASLISDMVEQVIVGTYSVDECVEQIMTEYGYLY